MWLGHASSSPHLKPVSHRLKCGRANGGCRGPKISSSLGETEICYLEFPLEIWPCLASSEVMSCLPAISVHQCGPEPGRFAQVGHSLQRTLYTKTLLVHMWHTILLVTMKRA